jgi:hypothetical protein
MSPGAAPGNNLHDRPRRHQGVPASPRPAVEVRASRGVYRHDMVSTARRAVGMPAPRALLWLFHKKIAAVYDACVTIV